MITVYQKSFNPPKIDKREILRYAGAGCESSELEELLSSLLSEAQDKLIYKTCYTFFPVKNLGACLDLGFATVNSKALQKNLSGCDEIMLFAATVGTGIDRLIKKYGALSPTKQLLLQAIGSERVEALCDALCESIAEELSSSMRTLRPRFSAGYGDLPLELQREIFSVLDCPRRIGLTLNDNLLMSPSKSVTAIVGIYKSGSNQQNG